MYSLIDDNDEDDLPVPSVLAYVYRFPADEEDSDQHKGEPSNETTTNSTGNVPDDASSTGKGGAVGEERKASDTRNKLEEEDEHETENEAKDAKVSTCDCNDTNEVASQWVQIGKVLPAHLLSPQLLTIHHSGGEGRKQLLLTPNGGVLRIIDSTLGGEVCTFVA